jgi:acyl-CoA synthetase (AMP-forming)/AMP-acid ligase II
LEAHRLPLRQRPEDLAHPVDLTDLGRFDQDDYLYVTGRIKDVIIHGGKNLSPQLIESAIVAETDARACCVVGRADRDLDEVPVAFVVCEAHVPVDAEAICDAVRRKLSRIYVPQDVLLADALPETAVGKVDRGPEIKHQINQPVKALPRKFGAKKCGL